MIIMLIVNLGFYKQIIKLILGLPKFKMVSTMCTVYQMKIYFFEFRLNLRKINLDEKMIHKSVEVSISFFAI